MSPSRMIFGNLEVCLFMVRVFHVYCSSDSGSNSCNHKQLGFHCIYAALPGGGQHLHHFYVSQCATNCRSSGVKCVISVGVCVAVGRTATRDICRPLMATRFYLC